MIASIRLNLLLTALMYSIPGLAVTITPPDRIDVQVPGDDAETFATVYELLTTCQTIARMAA